MLVRAAGQANGSYAAEGAMTDDNILDAFGREIQAEHTLISHRLNWYVTSQSFLFTAYAIAGGVNEWRTFFQYGMPLVGVALSVLALMAIWSALEVQRDLIKVQKDFIDRLRRQLHGKKEKAAADQLDEYAKTTCSGRNSGARFHELAMRPPWIVPVVFILAWLAAFISSVVHARPGAAADGAGVAALVVPG